MVLKACVVGVGYVGLPLTYLLAEHAPVEVVAYDIDQMRIDHCRRGGDHTDMIPDYSIRAFVDAIEWTTQLPADADLYFICVPTPDNRGVPDYSYVDAACRAVIDVCKKGAVLVLESTVAPGTVRDRIEPMVIAADRDPEDILLAFSPERINPGATAFLELRKSTKLVGVDNTDHDSFDKLLRVYEAAFSKVSVVRDTRAAELAKCFENFQRDMNIAMMNELVMQCDMHHIRFADVVQGLKTKPAASTHSFTPGMVGGHCIPVDPYYLADWYDPHHCGSSLPMAGRSMNDRFIHYVYNLARNAEHTGGLRILVIGACYKRDVADTRNSGGLKLASMFEKEGIVCDVYDPIVGLTVLPTSRSYNVVICAVNHSLLQREVLAQLLPLTIDCTAINVGGFHSHQLDGIAHVITLS